MTILHRVALLAFLAAGLPTIAYAQDPGTPEGDARARELYENGARLYDDGLYEDAATAWEEAYRLSKKELLIFNLANAYERMGKLEEALDHMNRYRAFAKADEADALERRISALEKRIKEIADSQPPPDPDPPPPDPDPPPPDPDPPPPDPDPVVDVQPEPEPEPIPEPKGLPVAAPIGITAAGLATLGVGMLMSGQAKALHADLSASCAEVPNNGLLCTDDVAADIDKQRSMAGTGGALVVGGIIVTAAGGGLFTLTSVSVSPHGVAIGGRW